MNILHHKSWHVRNKDNIERVRRDEENAAKEEEEKQRKIALAEQEARTELLRKRAKKRLRDNDDDDGEQDRQQRDEGLAVVADTKPSHINFFADIEAGLKSMSATNKEYEAEKKAEQEKREKDIGLLTYLGQSAQESQTINPWYTQAERRKPDTGIMKEKEKCRQQCLDPLNDMKEYVKKKKHKHHHHHDKEKEKQKKHKHHKPERPKTDTSTNAIVPTSGPSIDQLRAERLNREKEERAKRENLLARLRGEKTETVEPELDDRSRKYNSMFNPDFVKHKPKPKHWQDEFGLERRPQSHDRRGGYRGRGSSDYGRRNDRHDRHSEGRRHGHH